MYIKNNNINAFLKGILLFSLLTASAAFSCTRIFWNDNKQAKVFSRTMDFFKPDNPELLVFPEGIRRSGKTRNNPLNWTSKYGSVGIAEFHTDLVTDGINEKGLAVHLLYLEGTSYEKRNKAEPGLSNGLWAQYILDNFATVEQALKHIKDYQVVPTQFIGKTWPLHLAIEDATGDSAIIEFINGHMQIHHGHQYTVMTNEPDYDTQLAYLKRFKLFGGNLSLPGDIDPLSRFVRASSFLKTLPQPKTSLDAVADVYAAIKSEMVPFGAVYTGHNAEEIKIKDTWATRWVTLGDLTHRIYYFQSTRVPSFIWLDLNHLNFKKGSPVLGVNPENIKLRGNVAKELKIIKQ